MTGPRRRGAPGTGFTILELAVALALITLVATLAIPAFYRRPEVTLESAARLMLRDLRSAQNRAAQTQQSVRFEPLPGGEGYRVVSEEGRLLQGPGHDGPFLREYTRDAVFEGVRIQRVELGSDGAVRYDAYGFADEGGALELGYEGGECVVLIEARTGILRVHGLSEPWLDDGR